MKLFCALSLIAYVSATASKPGLRATNPITRSAPLLACHVVLQYVSNGKVGATNNRRYECNPVRNGQVSDFSYPVTLPSKFVDQLRDDLMAGNLLINIPGGRVVNGKVTYPANSEIVVNSAFQSVQTRHRRLASTNGTQTILILRITANDATNYFTASELFNFTFDTSLPDTKPSLASQFKRLSFGKLTFIPTAYGVMEVPINMNASGADITAIRNAAITYVTSKYNVQSITQLADHIMLCYPPGTGTWSGISTVNSGYLALNNDWCGALSATMHEMGHNLGLLHSNLNNVEYGDFTSYMSAGYETAYYPLKSFNGANNALLGWYNDRLLAVNPALGGQKYTLATFVDYQKVNKANPVLIKISSDIFLQYNRAKDFNIQTQQDIDQVTIVQQLINGTTNLLGAVDPIGNPQYSITNYAGTGNTVVIHACSVLTGTNRIPDSMVISIGYNRSYCV